MARICPRCSGAERGTCLVCRLMLIDSTRERKLFLAELWIKANKFLMPSFNTTRDKDGNYVDKPTGLEDVVKAEFGPWMNRFRERSPVPKEVKEILEKKGKRR